MARKKGKRKLVNKDDWLENARKKLKISRKDISKTIPENEEVLVKETEAQILVEEENNIKEKPTEDKDDPDNNDNPDEYNDIQETDKDDSNETVNDKHERKGDFDVEEDEDIDKQKKENAEKISKYKGNNILNVDDNDDAAVDEDEGDDVDNKDDDTIEKIDKSEPNDKFNLERKDYFDDDKDDDDYKGEIDHDETDLDEAIINEKINKEDGNTSDDVDDTVFDEDNDAHDNGNVEKIRKYEEKNTVNDKNDNYVDDADDEAAADTDDDDDDDYTNDDDADESYNDGDIENDSDERCAELHSAEQSAKYIENIDNEGKNYTSDDVEDTVCDNDDVKEVNEYIENVNKYKSFDTFNYNDDDDADKDIGTMAKDTENPISFVNYDTEKNDKDEANDNFHDGSSIEQFKKYEEKDKLRVVNEDDEISYEGHNEYMVEGSDNDGADDKYIIEIDVDDYNWNNDSKEGNETNYDKDEINEKNDKKESPVHIDILEEILRENLEQEQLNKDIEPDNAFSDDLPNIIFNSKTERGKKIKKEDTKKGKSERKTNKIEEKVVKTKKIMEKNKKQLKHKKGDDFDGKNEENLDKGEESEIKMKHTKHQKKTKKKGNTKEGSLHKTIGESKEKTHQENDKHHDEDINVESIDNEDGLTKGDVPMKTKKNKTNKGNYKNDQIDEGEGVYTHEGHQEGYTKSEIEMEDKKKQKKKKKKKEKKKENTKEGSVHRTIDDSEEKTNQENDKHIDEDINIESINNEEGLTKGVVPMKTKMSKTNKTNYKNEQIDEGKGVHVHDGHKDRYTKSEIEMEHTGNQKKMKENTKEGSVERTIDESEEKTHKEKDKHHDEDINVESIDNEEGSTKGDVPMKTKKRKTNKENYKNELIDEGEGVYTHEGHQKGNTKSDIEMEDTKQQKKKKKKKQKEKDNKKEGSVHRTISESEEKTHQEKDKHHVEDLNVEIIDNEEGSTKGDDPMKTKKRKTNKGDYKNEQIDEGEGVFTHEGHQEGYTKSEFEMEDTKKQKKKKKKKQKEKDNKKEGSVHRTISESEEKTHQEKDKHHVEDLNVESIDNEEGSTKGDDPMKTKKRKTNKGDYKKEQIDEGEGVFTHEGHQEGNTNSDIEMEDNKQKKKKKKKKKTDTKEGSVQRTIDDFEEKTHQEKDKHHVEDINVESIDNAEGLTKGDVPMKTKKRKTNKGNYKNEQIDEGEGVYTHEGHQEGYTKSEIEIEDAKKQKKKKKKKQKEKDNKKEGSVHRTIGESEEKTHQEKNKHHVEDIHVESIDNEEGSTKGDDPMKTKKRKTNKADYKNEQIDEGKGVYTHEGHQECNTKSDIEMEDTKKQKKKKKKKKKDNTKEGSVQRTIDDSEDKTYQENDKHHGEYINIESIDNEEGLEENVHDRHQVRNFVIPKNIWTNIEPETKRYGGKGRCVRRLKNNWTDIFANKINESHKGCVLTFKTHHVKSQNSRKVSAPFIMATAICKGSLCTGKFQMSIDKEPLNEEDVFVRVEVSGQISHNADEVNRRDITGIKRKNIAAEINKTSSVNTFYENILKGKTDEMEVGNYTSVPNQTVLRKIVSEHVKKETLHTNIMSELQVVKECYEKDNDPYIQEIGLDPFTLLLISQKQIHMLRTLSSQNKLDIYIDATGSIISNIPEQKRPYLYSVTVKPDPQLPPVSVADMISTQHTIPRIEHFLATLKRSVNLSGKQININKVETDFSFALIQASMHTFNSMSLKRYIVECMNIISSGNMPESFTVHHLCSTHMLKDFTRSLKTYIPKINKKTRKSIYRSFAALQNTTSLTESIQVFTDICFVFLSENKSPEVDDSLKRLEALFKNTDTSVDDLNEEENSTEPERDLCKEEKENSTLKEASPFTKIFEQEASKVRKQLDNTSQDSKVFETNSMYCQEVVTCLEDKFMHFLPLWSGIMLRYIPSEDGTFLTRDTNSPVENWFKFLKHDIGLKRTSRPSRFVIRLRRAVYARLAEHQFPGCRKTKTKKRKPETDANLETKEEVWKRKRTKKPTYHAAVKTKQNKSEKKENKKDKTEKFPTVANWGGKYEGEKLTNTCTIDNGLTILHLKYKEDKSFQENLKTTTGIMYESLLTAFNLMTQNHFTAAKLVWIHFGEKDQPVSTNLFGDESDMMVSFFDREWKTITTSVCNNVACPEPFEESRVVSGVTISLPHAVESLQTMIDKWLIDSVECTAVHTTQDESNQSNPIQDNERCRGQRTVDRNIICSPPVLVIRVYEHCLMGRISLDQILADITVNVAGTQYLVAGVTLHRSGHYCAIIVTDQYGKLWYDGLVGRLQDIPNDLDTWFPSHVFLCQHSQ